MTAPTTRAHAQNALRVTDDLGDGDRVSVLVDSAESMMETLRESQVFGQLLETDTERQRQLAALQLHLSAILHPPSSILHPSFYFHISHCFI